MSSWVMTKAGPGRVDGRVPDRGLGRRRRSSARSRRSSGPCRGPCRRPSAGRAAGMIVCSSRMVLSVQSLKAPSLKITQFCQTSTKAAPLWAAAAARTSFMCLGWVSRVRATKVAPAPRASCSGLNGGVDRAERRRLRLQAQRRRRRVLALGQAVDLVVEQDDLQVHVAPQRVDHVVAADRQAVAVAGDDPDLTGRGWRP